MSGTDHSQSEFGFSEVSLPAAVLSERFRGIATIIGLLNQALSCGTPQLDGTRISPHDTDGVASAVERALKLTESSIAELALTFRLPSVSTLSVLWPGEQ